MRSKLPSSTWSNAIIHVAALIRLRRTTYPKFSPFTISFMSRTKCLTFDNF